MFQSPFEVSDVLSVINIIETPNNMFQSPFEVSDVLRYQTIYHGVIVRFNPLSRFLTY